MRIRNIHERVVDADAEDIAPLLATIGQPDDVLYPPLWEPMWFDGPVAVGASGTHGTITAYEPGRLIEIAFPDGIGVTGTHTFTVTTLGPRRSLVRHDVDADATLVGWLGWQALIRPAHDAVLEQVLDRLQAGVGCPPSRPHDPPPYARLLRWFERPRARAVPVTQTDLLAGALGRVDHSDAYATPRRRETPDDPRPWAEAIFGDLPAWVAALMAVRERLVGLVGIDRGSADTFAVLAEGDDEVLLGADAGHLDFRASVRREPGRIVLTTLVRTHNRRGRAYFAAIRPLHALVVRAMLRRAAARLARSAPPRRPGSAPPRRPVDTLEDGE
ncbi:DUF2867 domain-containing protein [Rhodococcus triatomae]|uniref:DUF2867 domain-containing protein n=1 Tax=Rhodococcus triatomae TaxID=300028 RepID=A0A1G8LF18_9NOCA|nr:DUF2867 domain-containing protein [Rhodococcus triatomae]QNG20567.1 DUF2867 domain-containing protein [Rhodococcus triatomae]QNG23515.1 DUF2867 domain-containing protein [Rhodococcus triatomae]SDI53800.1 Protein of unknown function [Rhodococcus triatomae]